MHSNLAWTLIIPPPQVVGGWDRKSLELLACSQNGIYTKFTSKPPSTHQMQLSCHAPLCHWFQNNWLFEVIPLIHGIKLSAMNYSFFLFSFLWGFWVVKYIKVFWSSQFLSHLDWQFLLLSIFIRLPSSSSGTESSSGPWTSRCVAAGYPLFSNFDHTILQHPTLMSLLPVGFNPV